jgi:glyoxylase-like metal-dependent hydrolase (beta-lactamase superfamily II)
MPAVIDWMPLGPLETNCYIVRAEREALEAVVVDPSGAATEIRLALASHGARCAAILVTHGHFDHILGLADLAEGTGVPVYGPAGERGPAGEPGRVHAGRDPRPAVVARHAPRGGSRSSWQGCTSTCCPSRATRLRTWRTPSTARSSPAMLFAGSVGRTDFPGGDWPTLLASIRSLVDRFPPETAVHPATVRRRRS